jgi:UDP-3-O-acyl-N-acetylglucosamine deacetylase
VVSSIVRVNANPTKATSVSFTVTFSEPVYGVDATDFNLNMVGVSGATISSVSGTGAVRTVVVNTGTGSGTLGLDLVDNNTIIDYTNNLLGGSGPTNGNFTGQAYTVDKAVPVVSSIVRVNASPTKATSVSFTVTFSEPVYGVDAADFNLNMVGVSGATINSVSGTGAVRTVVVNTGTGSGTLGLDLVDNNTIIDYLGDPLGGSGSANGNFTGQTYTVDRTVPVVDSIVRVNANPTKATSVSFTVTFSEPVYGVDAADFNLNMVGVSGATISSVSGTGAVRTVVVNTGTGSGTLGLDLVDNNTIIDYTSNPLSGSGPTNGNFTGQTYTVDKTVPVVSSIVRVNANPTKVTSVSFTVTFSKPVYGVDAADFNLNMVGVSGATINSVSGTGAVRTVVVNTGTGSGTLGLDLVDNNTIIDYTNNPLGGSGPTNGNFTGQTYTVDKAVPVVSSIVRVNANPTKATSVSFTVTFSEPVYGVDATDFNLNMVGVSGATISSVSGTGAVRTVVVNTGTGSGTLGLDLVDNNTIIDYVGNPLGGPGSVNGNFTGQAYTVDKTVPMVSSITLASPDPTSAVSVSFTVTFSEPVYGVDAADFSLNMVGVSDATITSVSGGGAVRTVVVNTGSGSGTLGLNLIDNNTIVDYSNNPLGGSGPTNGNFTGDFYNVR